MLSFSVIVLWSAGSRQRGKMFHIFQKKEDHTGRVYCPCSGKVYSITEVSDSMIADRLLGDGFAVEPDQKDGSVKSPVDGTISFIYPTGHMFGIITDDGMDVVVHVGLNTERENGRGFTILKKKGQRVHHGDVVLKADFARMHDKYDTSVITVLPNCADFRRTEVHLERSDKEPIIEYGEE